MNRLARLAFRTTSASVAILLTACSGRVETDSRAADEAAIREADAAALKAISAQKIDATVSSYDEGASLFMPNAPIATGRQQIRTAFEQMFAMPGFNFAPKTTKIEVARSGDLAYAQGTYEFNANDPKGKPLTDRGKFVLVWKKQADNTWKIVADIWNSDMPPSPAPKA